jgi:hypothetical protein
MQQPLYLEENTVIPPKSAYLVPRLNNPNPGKPVGVKFKALFIGESKNMV